MLTEIYIRNLAIIDELRLQFHAGFNVLTGETGAGKSIILDAVSLILGERADATWIRAGKEKAYVEATFALNEALQAKLKPLLEEEGLDEDEEDGDADTILLAREVRLNGRNVCRVNGRSVTLSLLRKLSEPLIDIHGQGEHLSLLKPRSHLPLLDAYAGLVAERQAVTTEVRKLQKVQQRLATLKQDAKLLAQRIDMLQFQIQEIEAAKLQPNEDEELKAERDRLANAENLMQSANKIVALLAGLTDEDPSVSDMLGEAERAMSQLVKFDESKNSLLEQLQGVIFQVDEMAGEAQDYLDELEFNPSRLDFVEERLELINRLKRKYGETIEEILALHDKSSEELEEIGDAEQKTADLEKEQTQLLKRVGQMAQKLSEKRQKAAKILSKNVEQPLADLYMGGAKFGVEFLTEPDANGAYVGNERLAYDVTGIDRAQFVISTNPGEPMKPMAKVASGGETARLMLALKTALAQVDETPTLIFDEIDQGIGGRVGDAVGQKLWGLTAVAQHQVIVVTHLPQLAGYGDAHFHVKKKVTDGRTSTNVVGLDFDGRVHELGQMLGTQGTAAQEGAKAILTQVVNVKKAQTV